MALWATLAVAAVGVLLWRGVELPQVAVRELERAAAELRGGKPVSVRKLHLIFVDGALRLRAEDLRSLTGAPETRPAPVQADFSFSPGALLEGRLGLQRADVSGGDVTITLRRNGETAVAFGRPGAEPDFIAPKAAEDLPLALRARQWLDAAAEALQPGAGQGQLQRLRFHRAQLHLVDERSGRTWRAQDAHLDLRRKSEQLKLQLGATLHTDAGRGRLDAALDSDTALRSAHIEVQLEDALVRLFAGSRQVLGAVQAPFSLRLAADVNRDAGLEALDVSAHADAGVLRLGSEEWAFDSVDLAGRYTLAPDLLALDRLEIAGDRVRIRGSGRVQDLAPLLSGETGSPVRFDVEMPLLEVASNQLEAPLALRELALIGAYRPASRELAVESAAFRLGGAYAGLSATLAWGRDAAAGSAPGLRAAATLAGAVTAADVRALWPAALAPSARSWFANAMQHAELGAVEARVAIDPEDWSAGKLPDDALDVAFPVRSAVVEIIPEMEPLREAEGRVHIHGAALDVEVDRAMLGRIALADGRVSAPELSSRGSVTIDVHSKGDARAYIDLLLQTPLQIRDRLPFEPASITGAGEVHLKLTRPLRSGVTAKDVAFAVQGALSKVGAVSRNGDLRVSDWALSLQGDSHGMRFSGPLRLGDSRADLTWNERFGEDVPPGRRSRYTVRGELQTKDLDLIGVPTRGVAKGAVEVNAEGEGEGLNFAKARVGVDFAKAGLALAPDLWSKPVGAPGMLTIDLERAADGGVIVRDFDARGPGLQARGNARFAPDGRLIMLQTGQARIGSRYDVALKAWRSADSGLVLEADGAVFDATPFLPQGPSTSEARAPVAKTGRSLDLRVNAKRLLLREQAVVSGASIRVVMIDGKIDRWLMDGRDPKGGSLGASMTPADNGAQRDILLQSDDVGFALRALIGKNPIQGGKGRISGQWSPKDRRGALQLRVDDFRVRDLPLAAKLFSSVASLQGLSNLVNDDGLAFSVLDGAFRIENDVVRLSDAQAYGGSIGITASGSYDLISHAIEADGVLIPAYRLNSMLGEIPGLGRLFTSRKGEGVFGFTYSIRGDVEKARIAVNPASAFAPGIFRRVFEPAPAVAQGPRKIGAAQH